MTDKPFFSIVIPTYNRQHFLKVAIAITLQQTFQDFEVIISDNCSTDNTREVVKSFKDKRIRYFRNKKNIGAEPNYKKVMSYARGKYVFTMGDDDFILFNNTLETIKKLLDEKKYGFIRLNLIEQKFIGKGIRKSIVRLNDNRYLDKEASSQEIINFLTETASSHFAGLVIKNEQNMAEKIIDSEVTAWIKILYDNIKKHGALFLGKYYMIITWSQGGILDHYKLKKGQLMIENYYNVLLSYLPKNERENAKLQYYECFILLQPVIKLYGGTKQLITFNKRLLYVENRLRHSVLFWLCFSLAFVFPRSFWKLVRVIQHSTKDSIKEISDFEKVQKRYNYLNKKYFA